MGSEPPDLGRAFVEGLAAKDAEALASVLDPEIDFRGLTPSYEWRATSPAEVAEICFGHWFEPQDHIREVLDVRTRPVVDRHHLVYRLRVESEGETFLVEQQAYFDALDGRITRVSIMCSGYRPWEDSPAG